jgi:hypothetical protein
VIIYSTITLVAQQDTPRFCRSFYWDGGIKETNLMSLVLLFLPLAILALIIPHPTGCNRAFSRGRYFIARGQEFSFN